MANQLCTEYRTHVHTLTHTHCNTVQTHITASTIRIISTIRRITATAAIAPMTGPALLPSLLPPDLDMVKVGDVPLLPDNLWKISG